MKKELTVNTLALGNIKNRKKQYTIMIIGIILAMVFSSSIVFLYSAAQETSNANYYKSHGYETMIISAAGIDESDFKALQDDKTVESLGTAHTLGYAYNKNESKSAIPYLSLSPQGIPIIFSFSSIYMLIVEKSLFVSLIFTPL